MLGAYYAAMMLFYALVAANLLVNIYAWPFVVGIFAVKFISQTIVFYLSGKKLKYQSIAYGLLLLDFVYVFYLLVYGTKGYFTKNRKQW
jgi:hypothetical protein